MALICVARRDVAGDFGALLQITADHDVSRGRTSPVALLEAAIAAVEACDHRIVAVAGRRLGIDQCLGLGAPFLAFIRIAEAAQEVQRAEDFRQPLQIAIVGRGSFLL